VLRNRFFLSIDKPFNSEGGFKKVLQREIFENFNVQGEFISAHIHGNGHINDTFLVKTNNNGEIKQYILQRINHRVFKDIDGVMNNIELVTSHVNTELPNNSFQQIIKTNDNKNYYFCNKTYTYWRVYTFVENGMSLEDITDPIQFYETGLAFGEFQKNIQALNSNNIVETILDFHNTKKRFENLKLSIQNDLVERAALAKDEIDYLLEKKDYASVIVDLLEEKKIPYRITHNDTKLNNVIFDRTTGKALSVIDLDTIMPGSILYDFGDAIRYGANKGKEDDFNLENVGIDLHLFELFTQGFLEHTFSIMNSYEIDNLAFSSLLMTYELAMRFLEDFLNGDTYFKVDDDRHNLRRTKAQIALMKDIEKNLKTMEKIVKKIYLNCLNGNCSQK